MDVPVKVRFFATDPALSPYISTIYLTEVDTTVGKEVSDYLHPEWANIRFVRDGPLKGAIGTQAKSVMPNIIAVGPTSYSTFFSCTKMYTWGIGLLPLGWVKLVQAPASKFADRFTDGAIEPAFSKFAPLYDKLFGGEALDVRQEAAIINSFLVDMLADAPVDDIAVMHAQEAISDPSFATVSDLADRMAMSGRTLERLCCRAFGFPPKLLLRRQRFLRTLSQVMLDPSMRWIASLDAQYHDQAHFTRDFNRFMGMSASEYKKLPHPILGAAVFGRMAAVGAPMQALHRSAVVTAKAE